MTAVRLGRWPSGSEEWHAARAGRLGGSDMAAVLGLSPWTSPYALWMEKKGRVGREAQSEVMARGHYLEPALIAWFRDRHPDLRVVADAGTWVSDRTDWQLANPDGLCYPAPRSRRLTAIVEAKTASNPWEWGTPGTNEVPVHYEAQAQHYLDVMGVDVCWFAVLTANLEFREYRVTANWAVQAAMRSAGAAFTESLWHEEPPDLDTHPATLDTVRRMHPDIDGSTVELTHAEALEWQLAVGADKASTAALTYAKAKIADRIGIAKAATYDGATIAVRKARNGGTPWLEAARNLTTITLTEGTPA